METCLGSGKHQVKILSRLLQIGINGNRDLMQRSETLNFPDYFKSELMETVGYNRHN